MEISNAIIISAIIISFAAITVTITLIFKKKTLSLILFLLFSISIVVSLFYKKEMTNLFNDSKKESSNKSRTYKRENLGYKNMGVSPTLSDVVFTFGGDYFINADSSVALFRADDFFDRYDYKDCIKDRKVKLDCFNKDLVSTGNLVLLKNERVLFIGGKNFTHYYYHKSLSKLIEVYGNYNQVWSSSDNTKRIYRFNDSYFFLKEDNIFFYGQAFSEDFNVLDHRLLVLNDGYREIK